MGLGTPTTALLPEIPGEPFSLGASEKYLRTASETSGSILQYAFSRHLGPVYPGKPARYACLQVINET